MKCRLLLPTLVATSTILMIGFGVSNNIAVAQLSEDALIDSIDKIPMNGEVIDHESDPAVEERNIKNEFKGIDLTPQRLEQIKQARRQLRTGLKQVMKSDFSQILKVVFLPKQQAEERAGNILENPIAGYGEAISKILTPEEIKIWQRNLE